MIFDEQVLRSYFMLLPSDLLKKRHSNIRNFAVGRLAVELCCPERNDVLMFGRAAPELYYLPEHRIVSPPLPPFLTSRVSLHGPATEVRHVVEIIHLIERLHVQCFAALMIPGLIGLYQMRE